MSQPTPKPTDEGRIGPGTFVAVAILVVIVIGAIWYFNSVEPATTGNGVNLGIPTDDPGTETTIVP